jgi:hypothetical protein
MITRHDFDDCEHSRSSRAAFRRSGKLPTVCHNLADGMDKLRSQADDASRILPL